MFGRLDFYKRYIPKLILCMNRIILIIDFIFQLSTTVKCIYSAATTRYGGSTTTTSTCSIRKRSSGPGLIPKASHLARGDGRVARRSGTRCSYSEEPGIYFDIFIINTYISFNKYKNFPIIQSVPSLGPRKLVMQTCYFILTYTTKPE